MILKLNRLGFGGALLLLMFSMGGCTIYQGAWLHPQSHFDYPNSNVIPLGHAVGEASTTSIFVPVVYDADLWEEAVRDAIRQKQGDILIDYLLTIEVSTVPILQIYTTTYQADGTVAKMEIGKQMLR